MLCISLGKPPVKFDFEVKTPNGFVRDLGITPQSFFKKYVDMDLSQYISLINAPTSDKPYGKTYTVAFLGNVAEGRPVKYLNLPIEDLKAAAIAQMKDGLPVWFGCDVGKRSVRDGGVMDLNALDLETLFNTEFTMDKAQRLDYGQSLMTHAMVFQGVNLDDNGKPNRWSCLLYTSKTAVLVRDGQEVTVPVSEVRRGDVFVVRPGENIPVDGIVLEGASAVNESRCV